MPPHSDLEQVKAAIRDPQAFRPLYEAHYPILFRMMERRTRDTELAKDLTQQSFLKALQKLKSYKGKTAFGTWLIAIALNEMRMHYRKLNTYPHLSATTAQLQLLVADTQVESGYEHCLPKLKTALQQQKVSIQELIELRYFDQLPFSEIAYVLKTTEGAVKMKLKRALTHLKTQLQ